MKIGSKGKGKPDLGPAGPAVRSYSPALHFNNLFYDRQANARTARLPGTGFFTPVKPLENVRKVFLVDPFTGVTEPDLRPILVHSDFYRRLSPVWSVLQNVLDEVLNYLNHLI